MAEAPEIIGIASGKGGVGVSLIAVNLGGYLALSGRRVVLVDANLGGASLHTYLGVGFPKLSLADFLFRGVKDLNELRIETNIPNLSLVPGIVTDLMAFSIRYYQKLRFINALSELDADYVILDIGGGTSYNTLDLFLQAERKLLITLPFPAALEGCYRFLKAAFLRYLQHSIPAKEMKTFLDRLVERELSSSFDVVEQVKSLLPEFVPKVAEARDSLTVGLALNQVKDKGEKRMGKMIEWAVRYHLGIPLSYVGSIPYDEAMEKSALTARPLISIDKDSAVSFGIENLANIIVSYRKKQDFELKPASSLNYYQLLGISPDASLEEVARGYERMKRFYQEDNFAIYSLLSSAEISKISELIGRAYRILSDPEERVKYDSRLVERGEIKGEECVDYTTLRGGKGEVKERDTFPVLDEVYSGSYLKKIRVLRNIPLEEISTRTKITLRNLELIEEEDFASLPPRVYLRGFIVEYAKVLGLNPEEVVRGYLARYDRWRERRE